MSGTKARRHVKDPIHDFIDFDENEKRLIDTAAFQRLRSIHQLAMTYLVYPGASHKRFEHCLGVMELAGRAFDAVTQREHCHCEAAKDLLNEAGSSLQTWRNSLRFAALCHDLGHLPFSHAAEKELLAEGWDHERITLDIIQDQEVSDILRRAQVLPETVAKLALGFKKYKKLTGHEMGALETVFSELIVGDSFGVDRMDYLLRDAYHCGVPYGRFDHHRLLMNLRILHDESGAPCIGVTQSAWLTSLGMLFARGNMYQSVYFHPVRKVYDAHLVDFLRCWLGGGQYPTEVKAHLNLTDDTVLAGMRECVDGDTPASMHAKRILERRHFKRIKFSFPDSLLGRTSEEVTRAVHDYAVGRFGADLVRFVIQEDKKQELSIPYLDDGGIVKSGPPPGLPSAGYTRAGLFAVYADRDIHGVATAAVVQDLSNGTSSEIVKLIDNMTHV